MLSQSYPTILLPAKSQVVFSDEVKASSDLLGSFLVEGEADPVRGL